MVLRMTIEVELDEGAFLALDEDREFFEENILKNSKLISDWWIGENTIGKVTKIDKSLDYIMHEIKP